MVTAPKKKPALTPLAQWLLAYIQEQEITLTELARRSGLSSGALRSLVVYPERIPSLETCLRLAEATGRPGEEVAHLAGLEAPSNPDRFHPDRLELIRIYDNLPACLRQALVNVARAIQNCQFLEKSMATE